MQMELDREMSKEDSGMVSKVKENNYRDIKLTHVYRAVKQVCV